MKQPRHLKVISSAAVAAALLLSACGASGGSDDADEKTTTTEAEQTATTDSDTSTTEAGGDADAQARVDTVDLTISDFEDGWTSTPYEDDGEESPLVECDEVFGDDAKLATHNTDTFVLGDLSQNDGAQFSASTAAFASADDADSAVEVLNDEEVVSCMNDALIETLSAGTGTDVTGELTDDDLDVGTDNSSGLSAEYTFTGSAGDSVTGTVAVLAFSTGDLATLVNIISFGETLDPASLQAPVTALAGRQAAA